MVGVLVADVLVASHCCGHCSGSSDFVVVL